MATKVIQPKELSDPRPRYSQGILAEGGKLLFVAGQTASDKEGNVIGKGDIEAQTHQVFRNLAAVLKEAGGSLDNLVMTTTYITDITHREGYNRVRTQYSNTSLLHYSSFYLLGYRFAISVKKPSFSSSWRKLRSTNCSGLALFA